MCLDRTEVDGCSGAASVWRTFRIMIPRPSTSLTIAPWTLLLVAVTLPGLPASAQLPDGSTAPEFTLTDISGTTHHLYDHLDAGRTVLLEVFAAHCPTCWAYHQTHRLKNMHEQYGPGGTDELMVLALEYDQWNGMNELMGIGDPWVTAGDWVTGTPYPIFNVEDPDRGVFTDYAVTFYPVIYKICPDGLTERVLTSQTEMQLHQLVQDCQASTSIPDEADPGAIWFDPVGRRLVIERTGNVLGVEVLDLQGRTLQRIEQPVGRSTSVSPLPPGVYLFRLWTEDGAVVRRFATE